MRVRACIGECGECVRIRMRMYARVYMWCLCVRTCVCGVSVRVHVCMYNMPYINMLLM